MSEPSTQLAERQPTSVKDYLALPSYRDRFHEVMGKRANQFMAAIVASSQLPGLKDAEPRSVIAAAMVAATLDLPVNPTLGQAHIVAYSEKGVKVAQFQIGYKGLIQLALRSGQYKRLNAGEVNAEVFKGYDLVGEPVLDWEQLDPLKPVAGYFCAFETLNGFTKVVYWSKPKAEAHAKRFSYAYSKGYSTPWKSDFDSMATKTVIKAALSKWGLLSVEMQKAVVHDQGAQEDVDADVKYVDGADTTVQDGATEGATAPDRPAPPARAKRGAAAAVARTEVVVQESEQAPSDAHTAAAALMAEQMGQTIRADNPAHPSATVEQPSVTEIAKEIATHAPGTPRASLNDGETYETVIEVVSARPAHIFASNEHYSAAFVTTKGGYLGKDVTHPAGGEFVKNPDGSFVLLAEGTEVGGAKGDRRVNLQPIWTAGNKVKATFAGRKVKSGEIKVRIVKAELVEAVKAPPAPEKQPEEDPVF